MSSPDGAITLAKTHSSNPSVQVGEAMASTRGERMLEFDHLRGVAIALILLGHSIVNSNAGFPLWLENLLRGGTGVFVFISGFFFHRIFYRNFDFKAFMGKKLANVFLPFIVVSAVGLAVKLLGWRLIDGDGWAKALGNGWELVKGGYVLFPHWYIPFIMLTFLCSPLHRAYIRLGLGSQLALLLGSCLVAVLMQRPMGVQDPLQSLIYFSPFYLMGILYSQYLPWLREHYNAFFWPALVAVVLTVWLQSEVFVHVGNYHKHPFQWGGIDLQFIQKVGLCIVLVGACGQAVWPALSRQLCMLAEISFGLFFLHPLVGMIWGNTKYFLAHQGLVQFGHGLGESLALSLGLFLFQLYGTVLLIRWLKPRLGKKSRLLIGC
ncbi:acyltransferase [Gallaecimonas kandeliae]|uniref:acyltransferase family protein n=1 Tax=Gallaecimonas kandeliae TaxID=3029055 RepID=UPI002649FF3C|nr:acyltransferase [Gallaecimonas kandeliae]WKE66220.1 acyltransferase [Gallaecimonas kandeliae]